MLILKGESGKGRIIDIIKQHNKDNLVISIEENLLGVADYIVKEFDFAKLGDLKQFIISNISENCRYVIIYSNLYEEDINPILLTCKKIEEQFKGRIMNCIITCR